MVAAGAPDGTCMCAVQTLSTNIILGTVKNVFQATARKQDMSSMLLFLARPWKTRRVSGLMSKRSPGAFVGTKVVPSTSAIYYLRVPACECERNKLCGAVRTFFLACAFPYEMGGGYVCNCWAHWLGPYQVTFDQFPNSLCSGNHAFHTCPQVVP